MTGAGLGRALMRSSACTFGSAENCVVPLLPPFGMANA
jgi:hypothetical protein